MYHTLAKKHKTSIRKLIEEYGDSFRLKKDLHGIFPSKSQIASTKKAFLIRVLLYQPFDVFNTMYLKKSQLFFDECSVEDCNNIDIEIYNVRKIGTRILNENMLVVNTERKRDNG